MNKVKNLGWLLRHANEVQCITLANDLEDIKCSCAFIAKLLDGSKCTIAFSSTAIARKWIKRPLLSHVDIIKIA